MFIIFFIFPPKKNELAIVILTKNILMIEPVGFRFNPLTADDNRFQSPSSSDLALKQFEDFRTKLSETGINIVSYTPPDEETPDAVFPNNWFSTFPLKEVIVYPMYAENRRLEKRYELISRLKGEYSLLADLSDLEEDGSFLEGTGSLVIDHENKIAFACVSKRTTTDAINK